MRTAETLARLGGRVDVLAFSRSLPPGALDSTEQQARDGARITVHRFGLFANLDLSLQHTFNLVEWMHGERAFDLTWGHYLFPTGFAAVMLARLLGIKSTVSARGNDVDRMMFPPGDFARLRWTLEHADLVTAVSRELERKIDAIVGRPVGVERIPNSVDLGVFAPGPASAEARAERGIEPDEVVLGFAGELRHKKGLPFLLQALAQVRAQRPACLLVIGEVRPRELGQLQAFAADEPEAARRILVTGRIDDPAEVAACYRLCDLYLQPSVWEGLPNALLEAMASERVVLASDAGAIGEVIRSGEDGFILPKAQLHGLGAAALEVLARPAAERAAIGRAARARVTACYAASHEEAALQRVLDRLRQ